MKIEISCATFIWFEHVIGFDSILLFALLPGMCLFHCLQNVFPAFFLVAKVGSVKENNSTNLMITMIMIHNNDLKSF